ncbi:MAG: hypothetical protein GF364_06980 [Candidatus Lokiarchaeota archaeon]|nr:hypothetical protein [Candidatus Lokiarchaeota archaeon]
MKKNDLPIGIACRLDKENAIELTGKIINYFDEKEQKIVLENRISQRFSPHHKRALRKMSEKNTKMIISIGGDGTILRICQNLPRKYPAPILGINLGSVGFLDEIDAEKDGIYGILDKLIANEYIVQRSIRLASYYRRGRLPDALNEVAIVSAKPSKVLHVGIKIDNQLLNTAYVDGVIISTSVGSTAYCLSAGGAIVDPRLKMMQIVPINPFAASGSLKPIVIPSTSKVEIELIRPKLNALILVDGQSQYRSYPKDIIKVRKSQSDIKFVRLTKNIAEGFYNNLRKKILRASHVPMEDSPEP